jgi:hypothetical protein
MPASQRSTKARPPSGDNPEVLGRLNKALHAKLNELYRAGTLDDADYREILRTEFGVSSSADLDARGRRRLLWRLKGGPPPNTLYLERLRYWRQRLGERPGMATPQQLAHIDSLARRALWAQDTYGALRKLLLRMGLPADLAWLDFKGAVKMIEALKRMAGRR